MFTILDDIEYIGDNFCDTSEVLSVLRMVGYVLFILKLLIPIIIIYVETIKFVGAVKEGTQESVTKHAKGLLLRLAIGIIIIFIPTIIDAVLNSFISEDSKNCEICVLKPFSCNPGNPSSMNSASNGNNNNNNNNNNKDNNNNKPEENTIKDKIDKCDGYYNSTEQICIKKGSLTCKDFDTAAACKNSENLYGVACTYDSVSFQCVDKKEEEEETIIKPSGNIVTDISNFPNDALACSLYTYEDACKGNCKWTGSSCRSNVQVNNDIIDDLCSIAKTNSSGVSDLEKFESESSRCNSLDDYCTYDPGLGCYNPNNVE